jgi:hypothetical protein
MGKAVTDVALNQKLEQFVRETAQNSADAATDGHTPHLLYRYAKLENDELDAFLDAIDWPTLKPHLEAVAEDDDEIGVQSMLDRVDDGYLPLLIVEDRNATGLEGEEFSKETNYASLLQDFGSSTKDEDEGGVHGVGASVLWGFSGFKTTLFHSNPQSWADSDSPRLVGRVDLPYHESNGTEWQGDGWIGHDDGSTHRNVSYTGDTAKSIATDDLNLNSETHRTDSPGTTAVVVGFREPNRSRRSPGQVVDRIAELAAMYYWPLMIEDGLTVSVQAPTDSTPCEVDPRDIEWLTPYIDAYEARDTADDTLEEAPDFAAKDVKVSVPNEDGSTTAGEVSLVARTTDGTYDKYKNRLAMFRGARHVVKYRQYGYTARAAGQEFHGIVVAGRGRYPGNVDEDDVDDTDKVVEDFFRKAEPEAHDTWEEEVSKLERAYPGGHDEIATLFEERIPSTLENLLIDAGGDDSESLNSVGSQFPYFSGGPSTGSTPSTGGGGSQSSIVDSLTRNLTHPSDRYECTGSIRLTDAPSEDWTIDVEIGVVDAGGHQFETVDVATINASSSDPDWSTTSSTGTMTVPSNVTAFKYDLASVPTDQSSVGDGMARLHFEIDASMEVDE